ncbi:MAG: tetratricopeptide repeat protein [Acidobacteriia bacterium]|nr:tetratricopeptide repeat protein [Terriglobia bacterium]
MGRRLTRKQIKQDEFISLVDRSFHWMGQNWRQAAVGLGCVLSLALIYWGVTTFLGSRNDAAGRAIAEAVATYQAPVGGAASAGEKFRFATDVQRLDAAEKAFQAVSSKYWLTPQTRVAAIFLARIAADRGDQALAIRKLSEVTSRHSDDPLVRLAMLDLIRLRIAKGEGTQLVSDLEAMVAGKDPRLPRDAALFELARVWEHEGKPEEANRLYRKLVEDFPDSPYRSDAQQRLSSAS